MQSCWFENINYPVRILNTNASEGGGNLTGVSGAEPNGTFAISNFVDGYSYTGTFKNLYTARALIDLNLNGITGGPSEIGQNISEFLQNGGSHIYSNNSGSQKILDTGDSIVAAVGTYTYANLTYDTRIDLAADWTSYTPSVSSATGTITSYTINAAKYLKRGKDVLYRLDITITNNGTGGGSVVVTLPTTVFTPINFGGVLCGRENVISGKQLQGLVLTTYINVLNYDNTYPASTGSRLVLSGVFEVY
jgi:hypothetical protein